MKNKHIKNYRNFDRSYIFESNLIVEDDLKQIISQIRTSSGIEEYFLDYMTSPEYFVQDVKTGYKRLQVDPRNSDMIYYVDDKHPIRDTNRQQIKLGKLVREILPKGVEFNDKQIMEFVLAYRNIWETIFGEAADSSFERLLELKEELSHEISKPLGSLRLGVDLSPTKDPQISKNVINICNSILILLEKRGNEFFGFAQYEKLRECINNILDIFKNDPVPFSSENNPRKITNLFLEFSDNLRWGKYKTINYEKP